MAAENDPSSAATPVNADDERSKIAEWLAAEGFRPSIEDKLILFKFEGTNISLSHYPDTSPHTLMIASCFNRSDAIPLEMYLVAANRVNTEVFAAKAVVGETDFTISVESLLANPVQDFKIIALELLALINRSLGIFCSAIDEMCSDPSGADEDKPEETL